MKKLFGVVFAVCTLICFCISSFSFADDESEITTPPRSMLVLGDSISTGYKLYAYSSGNNYNTDSYANLLASSLHLTQGNTYQNLAVDGITSSELLTSLQDGEYDEYLTSNLICLTIGGNDLLGDFIDFLKESIGLELIGTDGGFINADFTNPELIAKLSECLNQIDQNILDFSGNLTSILSAIHEHNENAYIICQTVYNPLECLPIPETIKTLFDSKICDLNDAIKNCVKELNGSSAFVKAVDIYRLFKGQTDVLTNMLDGDIHPSAKGHKKIYEALLDVVNSHSFPASEETTEAETESARQASTQLENVRKSELTSVIYMCIFVAAFGVALFIALIFYIRRKRSGR